MIKSSPSKHLYILYVLNPNLTASTSDITDAIVVGLDQASA